MADFIVELAPNEEIKESQDSSLTIGKPPTILQLALAWDLYVDESLDDGGCEAGLIFNSSKLKC